MTRRSLRWLVAAMAALLAAWVVAPAALPVFDGIGQPDEPYRYVNPPATAKTTKAPTTATVSVQVRNGRSLAQFANSSESGPQVSVYVPPGALEVPAGATSITLTAAPLAPPKAPLPTDGDIVTNVYQVTAQADGKDVRIIGRDSTAPSMQMRAPSAKQPGPVFEQLSGSTWRPLHTIRAGNDIYQASRLTTFGEFALVQLASSGTGGGGGGGGVNVGLLVAGIGVLLAASTIIAIRMGRRPSTADPEDLG